MPDDRHRQSALSAVERSLPNRDRPRLSTELEAHFAPVDRESALCYADAELAAARLVQLAERIDDASPDLEIWDDISTVNHIEELRAAALAPVDEE